MHFRVLPLGVDSANRVRVLIQKTCTLRSLVIGLVIPRELTSIGLVSREDRKPGTQPPGAKQAECIPRALHRGSRERGWDPVGPLRAFGLPREHPERTP